MYRLSDVKWIATLAIPLTLTLAACQPVQRRKRQNCRP